LYAIPAIIRQFTGLRRLSDITRVLLVELVLTATEAAAADNDPKVKHRESKMNLSSQDIEMTFVRSLACSGMVLGDAQLSSEDRRERIRIAIMKMRVSNKPLPIDPTVTYAQAFRQLYNRPCELRVAERDRYGREILTEYD
jgi:hypothetical protein